MCKRNWKPSLVGVLAACALSAVAWQPSWATPPKDIAFTPISGPAVLDDIETKSESDINEVELKTKGFSHVYVTSITIKPGDTAAGTRTPAPPSSRSNRAS
jgi:hypothetical protein